MVVRTRFAPSPTGYLHVGGVRTALFSWLYAKHCQGEFVLRIEDTDKERSTQESVQTILEGMSWLGLDYQQGPIYQTHRYKRYLQLIERLLEEGKAYRCVCTKARLEALREAQLKAKGKPRYDGHCRNKALSSTDEPHVVRFKNPDSGVVTFSDKVYGDIHVDNKELDDLVLLRSDGHPTYNFAVVVDDWDMQITHVIRGDDHINNTPRQINLFKALDAPVPEFVHLPMILGDDGKRLSKRHGAVSVLQFRDLGVLPEALLNYLVRLGWSSGDQEIFTLEDMINRFDLNHISRAAASFNYEKLYWLNQHYQKNLPTDEVALALAWHFEKYGIDSTYGPKLSELIGVQAERCKTLKEMCEKSLYFYQDVVNLDPDAAKKYLRPVLLAPLTALYDCLKKTKNWQRDVIQTCISDVCVEFNLSMSKVAQPLRVAVTGSSNSPSIDITLTLIGQSRVLHRLESALDYIRQRDQESL